MKRVTSIRPGVAENRSALEAMTQIYKYLEKHYNYQFTIAHSSTDEFQHDTLDTVEIPPEAWKPTVPHTPVFLRPRQYRKHLDPLIKSADAVLTVDPTIFNQGALVINRASKFDIPVWYDASKTIADPDPHWYGIRARVKRAVERTAGIITTVPKVMERYRDLGLFNDEIARKFTLMGHPVDTERFTPTDESTGNSTSDLGDRSTTVLAMTRLVPEKGVYYLLEAMEPLLQSNDVELHFLGNGPMQPLLEREIDCRGISSNVAFLGTVPHSEVPSVLSSADVFVNHAVSTATWEEYFGAANLEAMACGIPTVVTDCGGIPYVIRDRDVVEMIPQRDVHELRNTIAHLVDDPDQRRKLGTAGRRYVQQNYSVEKIAGKYHEMLQRELSS